MRRYVWSILGICAVAFVGVQLYRAHNTRRHSQTVELAIEAMQAGRVDEAIAFLRAALSYQPDDAQTRYLMAQANRLQGNLEGALAELRRVRLDNENSEVIMFQTGGLLLALNRPGESEAVLRDCIKQFPQSVAARQYLLDVLGIQLRHREMLEILDELWNLSQNRSSLDRLWVLAKSFNVHFIKTNEEDVWPALQSSLQQEPNNVHTQVASGKLRMILNADVDEAARSLESSLERSPSNLEALSALTAHYVERGGAEAERINELLERWAAISQDAEYWGTLADWQTQQWMLRDALNSYRQATSRDPSRWRTLHKTGMLLIRLAKETDETDEPLATEGKQLLEEAASLKELLGTSNKYFDFLQTYLKQSASGESPKSKRLPAGQLADVAAFCEAVHCNIDAMRWCDLVQEIAPGEPATSAIRERLFKASKSEAASG
jgi:tetratricopeptide (TPR) repeat protein